MPIIPTLLLGLLVFVFDTLTGSLQFLHRWVSGCLISVVVLVSVVGGLAGMILLGAFLFNL
ncbi:MAG: hypothetical protein KDE53_38105 [Caldilineaceae bacterium]|nr:hypothetical protein [Caldilineaceae bacterium]MCB0182820.1 hypothetical protein [Caldilineaceae bacterium]